MKLKKEIHSKKRKRLKMKYFFAVIIVCVVSISSLSQQVNINGTDEGRVFEGVGAVSAGASSRLLIDYSEPYRSDILDFIFKPNFGASLHHFKVEIGGDINSTCGTEPSHARTRDELVNPKEEYFRRGYEFWMMSEAKKRNPDIILDCLEWGAPGWFSGGFYSQDNADYIVGFIKGAKQYWDLDIEYTGVWNETHRDGERDYIVKKLRPTLDANDLSHVRIIADDMFGADWKIATMAKSDIELKNALYALGCHYVNNSTTQDALYTEMPLWESEAWSKSGEWNRAVQLTQNVVKNYIYGLITKTIIWNPLDAYFGNVIWNGIGPMTANTPWCGYYIVEPAIWALAHVTQFTKPGWIFIDSGCYLTSNGTHYVTLKKPDGSGDYSIIINSGNTAETITFNLSGGLSTGKLSVWKSNSDDQFIKQSDITPVNNSFKINLEAGSIYSLTTTTGQHKGTPPNPIPEYSSFPQDYLEDFETYETKKTPKYLSDQGGAFEVYQAEGESKTLRQVITGKLIFWDTWGPNNAEPFTEFGDKYYRDYEVSVDALIETTGRAKIYGRVTYFDLNSSAKGYGLIITEEGYWRLLSYQTILKSGKIDYSPNTWHNLKLNFSADTIRAYIDGQELANVLNSDYRDGFAGIGSDWHHVRFDNLKMNVTKASFEPLISGATYKIINKQSGKIAEPMNGENDNNVNVVQNTWANEDFQKWTITNFSGDYYKIINLKTGKALAVKNSSMSNGGNIEQEEFQGKSNQLWKLELYNGSYKIIAKHSNKVAQVDGESSNDYANISQWDWVTQDNELWFLEKVLDPVSVNEKEIPVGYLLSQNYPNPFNLETIIEFSIPERAHVSLKIFDLLGREATSLVNEEKGIGHYSVKFDASGLASGIYYYKLQSKHYSSVRKLILLK
jgi:hypothetical protein